MGRNRTRAQEGEKRIKRDGIKNRKGESEEKDRNREEREREELRKNRKKDRMCRRGN